MPKDCFILEKDMYAFWIKYNICGELCVQEFYSHSLYILKSPCTFMLHADPSDRAV
jgi:hypothetical protein